MSIKDNGVGFELKAPNQDGYRARLGGNGLQNMESRAATLGGRLTVVSSPGKGTEVRLTLPLFN